MGLKERIRRRIVGSEDEKRQFVRGLFGRIAGRYDLTNDVMSLGLHRRWKESLVSLAAPEPGHRILDLAAGTGDLALRVLDREPGARVVAADLTPEMMEVGRRREGADRIRWVAADALELPFGAACFDRVLVGYGLRNFPDLERSLREIRRCLTPGGVLVSLDFGKPALPWLRRAYLRYLEASTWLAGWALHRDPEAYVYIPESLRAYPSQAELCESMTRAGFSPCTWSDVMLGTMAIHVARRPA